MGVLNDRAFVVTIAVICISIAVISYSNESEGAIGDSFTVGDYNYTVTLDAPATVEVTGASNSSLSIISIPSSVVYNNVTFSVSSIAADAFKNMTSATSIEIPASITRISGEAFRGCSSVNTIYYNATSCADFSTSHPLVGIGTSGGVDLVVGTEVTKIPANMFYQKSMLRTVSIGPSVTIIGDKAFYSNSQLLSVDISSAVSLTTIGLGAFWECSKLSSFDLSLIPVSTIGNHAFSDCIMLESITVPHTVSSLGERAFYRCIRASSVYFDMDAPQGTSMPLMFGAVGSASTTSAIFGPHAKHIPASIFVNGGSVSYNNLQSVQFSDNVESIGTAAFRNCIKITSIDLPASLKSIDEHAFAGCTGLTSITIPENVKNIGDRAFEDCRYVTMINYNARNLTGISDYSHIFYQSSTPSFRTVIIGDAVERIPYHLFYGETVRIKSLTISESVKSIEKEAFASEYSLETISLLGNPRIGDGAFALGTNSTTYKANCTVYAMMDEGFLEEYINEYTSINYIQLPHVVLKTGVDRLDSIPEGWFAYGDDLIKYYSNGEHINLPTLQSKGVKSSGWQPSPASAMGSTTQIYTAEWQIVKHTVTYNTNGGSYCAPVNLAEGEIIPLPTTTRQGYQFAGWSIPSGTKMGNTDLTVYASWSAALKVTVHFISDGFIVKTATGDPGSVLKAPSVSKPGYRLSGWSGGFNGLFPSSDKEYIAEWVEDTPGGYYSVYYYNQYKTPVFLQSYQSGKPISGLTEPKLPGYEFNGWVETITTMPAHDITLTPIWVPFTKEDSPIMLYAAVGAIAVVAIIGLAYFIRKP